jgi:hypothetical protein
MATVAGKRVRAARAREELPLWQIVAFSLCGLATLITLEIGLMFLIAKLVTGHAY